MKKLFLAIFLAAFLPAAAGAFDLNDLKQMLGGNKADTTATDKGSSALGNILSGILSNDKIDVSDLVGKWNYTAPAVCFRSENFLKKAGGAAAATAIENKLSPYYHTTGLDRIIVTINADNSFVFNVRGILLKGTVSTITDKNSDYNFRFDFTALKSIKIGQMNAYVVKSGKNSFDLMFDVSKLIEIASKVSKVTKSATISATVDLLNSYEGICAGFSLKKE